MNQLRVCLFGKFSVYEQGGSPIHLTSHKEEELLCYLVLKRGRSHSREGVASLLWSETTTDRSKKYLRTALWRLRSDLGYTARDRSTPLVVTANGWMQLQPDLDIWVDVNIIERAFDLVRGVSGADLAPHVVKTLEDAVAHYRGRLLEGWYQDWCLYERERLHQVYSDLMDKLMTYYEVHHEFEKGLSLGHRMLNEEPARESTHRRLMRLSYLAGDRCAALRQYHLCEETLGEELDIKPSSLTQALYEQIRTDSVSGLLSVPAPRPVDGAATLRQVMDRLAHLQTELSEVQQQLQQGLETMKAAPESRRHEPTRRQHKA